MYLESQLKLIYYSRKSSFTLFAGMSPSTVTFLSALPVPRLCYSLHLSTLHIAMPQNVNPDQQGNFLAHVTLPKCSTECKKGKGMQYIVHFNCSLFVNVLPSQRAGSRIPLLHHAICCLLQRLVWNRCC